MVRSLEARAKQAEIVDRLERGILELKSSTRWAEYLMAAARFHRYRTGRSAIFQRFESLPSRRWTQRSVQ
jgi:hypothetical protein